MADTVAIETADLRKTYKDSPSLARKSTASDGGAGVEALRGLSLQVPVGSICGFLGKNGAGKTTTNKILLGMTHPTSGDARVFGLPAREQKSSVEIRRRTGFVSDDKDLYGYMTVAEMVRFTAAFFPRWRADLEQKYLHAFELPPQRKVKALSRGMRTKLALLLALSHGAELLILDEPTSGLDPAMTEEVLQALVAHVASAETTVFFSSHQIAEVDQIADRVVIIDRGRAVLSGALDDLREKFRRIQLVFDGDAPAYQFRAPGVERVARKGRVLTVLSSTGADPVVHEARALNPVSVDVVPVTLREISRRCHSDGHGYEPGRERRGDSGRNHAEGIKRDDRCPVRWRLIRGCTQRGRHRTRRHVDGANVRPPADVQALTTEVTDRMTRFAS